MSIEDLNEKRVYYSIPHVDKDVLEELAYIQSNRYIPHGSELGGSGCCVYGLHIVKLPNFEGWPLFPESLDDYAKFRQKPNVDTYRSGTHMPWECGWSWDKYGRNPENMPFNDFKTANIYLNELYNEMRINLKPVDGMWFNSSTSSGIVYSKETKRKHIKAKTIILRPDNGLKFLLSRGNLEVKLKDEFYGISIRDGCLGVKKIEDNGKHLENIY